MIRRIQALGAIAGIAVALAYSAHVQAAPAILRVIAVTDERSDSNLRWARRRLDENLEMLQQDRPDYDGHRVRAIALFEHARQELDFGLAYDGRREDVKTSPELRRPEQAVVAARGERASAANLQAVRSNVEGIIDVLQRDNRDYGGHRAAALRLLDEGREQLTAALAWDRHH